LGGKLKFTGRRSIPPIWFLIGCNHGKYSFQRVDTN